MLQLYTMTLFTGGLWLIIKARYAHAVTMKKSSNDTYIVVSN